MVTDARWEQWRQAHLKRRHVHAELQGAPASHVTPTITPRTTLAANLRAGIVSKSPERTRGPRVAPSKEKLAQMFANVPGHKRLDIITVASTAPPVVVPRMTRAASLRLGQTPVTPPRPKPSADSGREKTFEGVLIPPLVCWKYGLK